MKEDLQFVDKLNYYNYALENWQSAQGIPLVLAG